MAILTGMRRNLIALLICTSLIVSGAKRLLVFISHLHVFFGEVSVYGFCPLFHWVVHFSGIELHELLIHFGD